MGYNLAYDLAHDTELDLSAQIAYHLRANHYPPVPSSMVAPCLETIDAYAEGDWQREINLPEGILWRGKTSAPAHAIAQAHHLDAWIYEEDGE